MRIVADDEKSPVPGRVCCRRPLPSLDTLNYRRQDLTRHYPMDLLAVFQLPTTMKTLRQTGLSVHALDARKVISYQSKERP